MSESSREPLVSVLMAVYNGDRYLKAAVESLLAQTYAPLEIILIDDASTDSSAEILAEITDSRLKVFRNPQNLGLTQSLIIARQHATGEYLARQDADDLSHPERFARQVEFLQANWKVGLVHSDYSVIDANGRQLDTVRISQQAGEDLRLRLVGGNVFAHGPIMMGSKCYDAVGGYRSFMKVTQDYDLYLRISEVAELANLPQVLYSLRFHTDSIGRKRRESQLSYQQLAWELARRRRAGLTEGDIPGNVVDAFPPDRSRLFQDARGSIYLFYAAGQPDLGAEMIRRALSFVSVDDNDPQAWEQWALAKAHHLTETRLDLDAGCNMLEWLVETLCENGVGLSRRQLIGRYYADQAFQKRSSASRSAAAACAFKAIRYNPHWAANRGLWKISLQALLRPGSVKMER